MKYILKFSIVLIFSFTLIQCQTSRHSQIKKEIIKSYSVKSLNKEEFDESRKRMIETLSPEIIENDTIILMEYFTNVNGNYSCTIYESKNRLTNRYIAQRSMKKNRIYVDSLVSLNIPDKILGMVLAGDLDEIKIRGDEITITPAATLIINIGVKNKEKKKFDFITLVTQEFSTERK